MMGKMIDESLFRILPFDYFVQVKLILKKYNIYVMR